jgi:hypothetical protein
MNAETILDLAHRGLFYASPGRPSSVIAGELGADPSGWVVAWAHAGQASGHEWRGCPICHQAQLVALGAKHGCKMTPRCPGHLERLVPWPRRSPKLLEALKR